MERRCYIERYLGGGIYRNWRLIGCERWGKGRGVRDDWVVDGVID